MKHVFPAPLRTILAWTMGVVAGVSAMPGFIWPSYTPKTSPPIVMIEGVIKRHQPFVSASWHCYSLTISFFLFWIIAYLLITIFPVGVGGWCTYLSSLGSPARTTTVQSGNMIPTQALYQILNRQWSACTDSEAGDDHIPWSVVVSMVVSILGQMVNG